MPTRKPHGRHESPAGAVAVARPRDLPTATPQENIAIGQLIHSFRSRQKLSQIAFADKIGILPSALSRFERGAQLVPASILFRIATAFHLPVTALLTPTPDPTSFLTPAQRAALSRLIDVLAVSAPQFGYFSANHSPLPLTPGETPGALTDCG